MINPIIDYRIIIYNLSICVLCPCVSFIAIEESSSYGVTQLFMCYIHLTKDDEDKQQGGYACCDVEHDPNVVSQLVHVVHIGHQDGRNKEADGDA